MSKYNPFSGLSMPFKPSISTRIEQNNEVRKNNDTASVDAPATNRKRQRSNSNSTVTGKINNKTARFGSTLELAQCPILVQTEVQSSAVGQPSLATGISNKSPLSMAAANSPSPHATQFHPFPRLPFDIRYQIWKEAMSPTTRIIEFDTFEKFHSTFKPQERKSCRRCDLTLPGPPIGTSSELRLEVTELIFCGETPEFAAKYLRENKEVKNTIENVGDEEILFIPDLMKRNGLGWARLKNLSSFARQNIRSLAFYVSPDNHKRSDSFYWYDAGHGHGSAIENLAKRLEKISPYLENIFLVMHGDGQFGSAPPPTKAWSFIPGLSLAGFQESLEARNSWVAAYAEGHHVKNLLCKYLRCAGRKRHASVCLRSNTLRPQLGNSVSGTTTSENAGREFKTKVDFKIVGWGS